MIASTDTGGVTSPARIEPLPPTAWDADQRRLLEGAPPLALLATLVRHPILLRSWLPLAKTILYAGALPERDRELLVLRTAWNCRSDYEWGAHAPAGRAAGLTVDELQRIALTPLASAPAISIRGWNEPDAAIIRAVDELFVTDMISEPVWISLGAKLDRRQRIDLLITIGGYRMVSMALNTLGVPLEPGSDCIFGNVRCVVKRPLMLEDVAHGSCLPASRQASKYFASSLLCGGKTISACPAGTSRTVSPPCAKGAQSALCRSELPALLNIVM